MSLYVKQWGETPACCQTCRRADVTKYGDHVLVSCNKDIRIPVKKQSCAKHLPSFDNNRQEGKGNE